MCWNPAFIRRRLTTRSDVVDLELECRAMSPFTIRASSTARKPNTSTSDRWRIGLTLRYIPTSTRTALLGLAMRANHPSILVRGHDRTRAIAAAEQRIRRAPGLRSRTRHSHALPRRARWRRGWGAFPDMKCNLNDHGIGVALNIRRRPGASSTPWSARSTSSRLCGWLGIDFGCDIRWKGERPFFAEVIMWLMNEAGGPQERCARAP